MPLTARLIDDKRFSNMADQWHECLKRSDAHPLFMSWPWLFSWWETWSDELKLDLVLVGVFDGADRLVGIGPFYRRDVITPVGIRIKRLHFIGNAWRIAATVRTEYCGLILCREHVTDAGLAILEFVSGLKWDEWIICDLVEYNLQQIGPKFERIGFRTTEVVRSSDEGVRIDVRGAFQKWLARLGSNTRLKVYNRRTYLQRRGHIEFVYGNNDDFENFLRRLNEFHIARWGKFAFDKKALEFHKVLKARLHLCEGSLQSSLLLYNGECVSVLYDITVGGHRLNLQSGYRETFDRKVSLGSLHLGFAIEHAHNDPEVFYYDLLAGAGKSTYYKKHFGGRRLYFYTLQWVRTPWLRLAYSAQAALPSGLRRSINAWFRL